MFVFPTGFTVKSSGGALRKEGERTTNFVLVFVSNLLENRVMIRSTATVEELMMIVGDFFFYGHTVFDQS